MIADRLPLIPHSPGCFGPRICLSSVDPYSSHSHSPASRIPEPGIGIEQPGGSGNDLTGRPRFVTGVEEEANIDGRTHTHVVNNA